MVICGYYICPKCKLAMTEDELAMAIRANEDADTIAKLLGREVIKATKRMKGGSHCQQEKKW